MKEKNRKIILVGIVLGILLVGLVYANNHFLLIWNANRIDVKAESPLTEEKVKIRFGVSNTMIRKGNDVGVFGNIKDYALVYDGKPAEALHNEYGENDFLITYNDEFYLTFRHFKLNRRQQHTYEFNFREIDGVPNVSVNIKGGNGMAFEGKMLSINEAEKHIDKTGVAVNKNILSYEINPKKGQLGLYLKDENGNNFRNFKNLRQWLATRNKKLIFAMNGGMYQKNLTPQGLYIENGKLLKEIDTNEEGYGNFYMKPNGIFILSEANEALILTTEQYVDSNQIKFATQSGPMLVINGSIHAKFNEGSKNVHIRNGVGVLPDGKLLFAMSKVKINFYDFAQFFLDHKCENALYLDGFVSKTYLPSKNWIQEDGDFGVIIGEVE